MANISKGDTVVITADLYGHRIPINEECMVLTVYPPAAYMNSRTNYGVFYEGRTEIVDSEEITLKSKKDAKTSND